MKGMEGNFCLHQIVLKPNAEVAGKSYAAVSGPNRHNRFGHAPEEAISRTAPLVTALERRIAPVLTACESCLENQSKRDSRNPADERICGAQISLDLVHSDLCGLLSIPSVGKSRYFVTLNGVASPV